MGPFNREIAPHMQAAIAASTELQERAALKQVGYTAAMAGALRARGVPDPVASLAAELGALAFKEAFVRWVAADNREEFGELACAALERLRATAAQLG